ncbi:MAG: DmsE family decaheme c-type cytochrome [bacterium]|nr:DmsE family decaheme c-type cytochrome [bacterium]
MERKNIKSNQSATAGRLAGLLLLALVLVAFNLFTTTPYTAAAGNPDESAVEQVQTCAECHDDLAASFKNSVHAVIDKKGLAGHAGAEFSCASCHGDTAKHLEEAEAGTIFAFKELDPANAKSKMCLSCHKNDHAEYFASPHGKAAMDCTSCHSVHNNPRQMLLKTKASKACAECHQDVMAKFKMNERHRLKEGILECSSCHDPHKPATRERLAGFKQETCYKCHADKQGPFLYEHGSVRIEGCTSCHDVHGSPNRHLLVDQSVSQLCYSCHTTVPGWHSRFTPASNCANCHSTIHGSNHSPKFLK